VLINNWEAHFFKFNRRKLLSLARSAKRLGIELFVLDDGWFGKRDNDRAGLGDYTVNLKKLPGGMPRFANKIRAWACGSAFGLSRKWSIPTAIFIARIRNGRWPRGQEAFAGAQPACA
jgi:alpha-galactosidase